MEKQEYAEPAVELVVLEGDVSATDVIIDSTQTNVPGGGTTGGPGYGGEGDGSDMD